MYQVDTYQELDFENVTMQRGDVMIAECETCGSLNDLHGSGIWTCDICDAVNFREIEA